jgi:Tfp pilus assembly protein FimV
MHQTLKLLSIGLMAMSASAFAYKTITVPSGGTLWGIAHANRVTGVSSKDFISSVKALNPSLQNGGLQANQKLKLPTTQAEYAQVMKTAAQTPDHTVSARDLTPQGKHTLALQAQVQGLQSQLNQGQAHTQQLVQTNAQLEMTIQKNKQQMSLLKHQLLQFKDRGHFPWGWLWFVMLVIVLLAGYRKMSKGEGFSGFVAASRLGKSPAGKTAKYKTDRFDKDYPHQGANKTVDHSSVLADISLDLAEGNYSAAEKRLTQALAKDAQNMTLRMKLLDVYTRTDNQKAFDQQISFLQKTLDEDDPDLEKAKAIGLDKWVYS